MLARHDQRSMSDYVSDRVYTGARPVSPSLLAVVRANHKRTHRTTVHSMVAKIGRVIGLKAC